MLEQSLNQPVAHAAHRSWSEWNGWPYILVGLSVILRLVHIWNSRTSPTFWAPAIDPAWYDDAAQNILRGVWGPFPLFRAPLYPALLAGIYGIFGHNLVAARMLNVALQAMTVWALWRVGKSYFSAPVGVLAAAFFAVNGMAIYFAGEILSTSAEMLAAVFCLWSTLRLTRDRSFAAALICGLSWGLAAITRPNFLMVFPIPLLAIWVFLRGESAHFYRAKMLVIWLVGAFLPILPVTAANYLGGGEFVLIATQGGVNFWIGNNPESTGIVSVLPSYGNTWTMEDAQREADRDTGRELRPGELSSYYFQKGWDFLFAHPLASVRFIIRKTLLFFNSFEISNNKHISHFVELSPWLPPLLKLNFGLLLPLAVLGSWVTWRGWPTRLIGGLVLAYAASVILFFVTSRFRMPIVPWLSLPAAAGLTWIVNTLRNHPKPRALLPLLLLIPGSLLAFINLWNLSEAPVGWARYMEGNAFLKLNQLDSARAAFLDALRDGQAVSRTELNLGVTAFRRGNYDEAKKWYEASLEDGTVKVEALNNLGTVSEAMGDTAAALNYYQQALSLEPNAPDPKHNLAALRFRTGVSALRLGQDSLAAANLEECLLLQPTAIVHYDLAIAYGRLGRQTQAIKHLDIALRIDPNFAEAIRLREQIETEMKASPTDDAAAPNRDSSQ